VRKRPAVGAALSLAASTPTVFWPRATALCTRAEGREAAPTPTARPLPAASCAGALLLEPLHVLCTRGEGGRPRLPNTDRTPSSVTGIILSALHTLQSPSPEMHTERASL
jgi:hypothetical protein